MPEDKQPGDLNLDLIQMVQEARRLHDAAALPSALSAVYWIEAKRQNGDFPPPTANAGEWRVRLPAKAADAVWARVKALTLAGELGYKSKISTSPTGAQAGPEERLLCVRTYDAADSDDVARVKRALLAIDGLRGWVYAPDKA